MDKEIVLNGVRYRAVEDQEPIIKPTLDDYLSIKTYEDACEALGEIPYLNDLQRIIALRGEKYEMMQTMVSKPAIAYMKLETIARALHGRDFNPYPFAKHDRKYNTYWYPHFSVLTEDDLEKRSAKSIKDARILKITDWYGPDNCVLNTTRSYFGYCGTCETFTHAAMFGGTRLCQEYKFKAKYFGKQFIELWATYCGFETDGFIEQD